MFEGKVKRFSVFTKLNNNRTYWLLLDSFIRPPFANIIGIEFIILIKLHLSYLLCVLTLQCCYINRNFVHLIRWVVQMVNYVNFLIFFTAETVMADPRIKTLKIKTGVVKRLTKEKLMYIKETEQQREKVEKLKASGK